MNKELTPLEALQDLSKMVFIYGGAEQYKIIENALKNREIVLKEYARLYEALEIIKDKISWNFAIKYWWENHEINDEEYDLLKKVLL